MRSRIAARSVGHFSSCRVHVAKRLLVEMGSVRLGTRNIACMMLNGRMGSIPCTM